MHVQKNHAQAFLGASWAVLGVLLVRLGAFLGRLGEVLEATWAVLERRDAEKARTQKTFKN